jgi:hypothetical protein
MNRRAAVIASGALVALTLPLASPAGAAPPVGGCPPPFMLVTEREQVALAMRLLGLSEDEAMALVEETLATLDKNGDRSLCFASQNKVRGEPNIIDNTARAH